MRVLIADDNQINREFVKGVLEGEDFELQEAANGLQAVQHCRDGMFDVILMDIRMPELDGIEATRQIRELPGFQNCPIIALTADLQLEKSNNLGRQDFSASLLKPVSRERLLEMLRAQTTGPTEHPDEADKSDLPAPVDREAALAAAGGSEALLERLLEMLRVELGEFIPRIGQALVNERWDEAREMAHKTRGSAGYTGARHLQQAASALELALTRQQSVEINQAFDELRIAAEEFKHYLDQKG